MTWIDRFTHFTVLDAVALLALIATWSWISWRIENPPETNPSVSKLMIGYRADWMVHMVTREPRIFDSQVVSIMRQGTAFFASASMLAIGGGLALVGNPAPLQSVASDLTYSTAPEIVWEVKLILIIALLASAFLKFVWSHRLFGYCAIIMAAVPNDPDDPMAYPRAEQAAEISSTAARSFNKAMRTTYFSLAATAWLLGPVALMIATAATLAMLYRREFTSQSRTVLLNSKPVTKS